MLFRSDRKNVEALLITHEHSDHIKGVRVLARKLPHIKLYANPMTSAAFAPEEREAFHAFASGERFAVGDIEVKAFHVSHDAADPVGFSFFCGGRQLSIVTDTGVIPEALLEEICEADLLVLEANYDADMLLMGRYPWFLKKRIAGEQGHLSNEAASMALLAILTRKIKKRQVLLAHLSKENNFPEMALQTVKNALEENDFFVGKHIELDILRRDERSAIYRTE